MKTDFSSVIFSNEFEITVVGQQLHGNSQPTSNLGPMLLAVKFCYIKGDDGMINTKNYCQSLDKTFLSGAGHN